VDEGDEIGMARKYTTRTGKIHIMQSSKTLERAILADNSTGFCLACGAERSNTEPDARKYPCETCGAAKVYGAEELLMMGLYYTAERKTRKAPKTAQAPAQAGQ
jgi:sulfatase maturation enzyme AslB (radical SAM superfamily)